MDKILNLYDLNENEEIKIIIKLENRTFEFDSKIVKKIDSNVALAPILINNQVLNLENKKAKIELLKQNENKRPILWRNCSFVMANVKNYGKAYLVVGYNEGEEINRRENYRIYIGLKSYAQFGIHTPIREFMIKDLSTTGFCIVGHDEEPLVSQIGKRISISFEDKNFNYHIILEGTVVRETKHDNGRVSYGCQLSKKYTLETYLSLKQREFIAKHSDLHKKPFDYSIYKRTRKSIR